MIFQTFRNDAMKRALSILAIVASTAILSAENGIAQSGSGTFVTPEIKASQTIGGDEFGGDVNQLENISGETVGGNAVLQPPNLGEYGPVGGFPRSTADQSPSLTPEVGETIRSQSQVPQNEYRGELIQEDWFENTGGQSQENILRDPVIQNPTSSQPRSNAQLTSPRLRINSLKSIESANREFDSRSHEIVRERYADGSIKVVRTITQDAEGNYYNDGGWLMYDRQQRPIASGTFVRGAMEGEWERVHESGVGGLFSQTPYNLFEGPYLSRANFIRNRIDGVWSIADKSGKVICSITYQDGQRNGLASWFYPNGKKMREASFKDGVPNGFVMQWDRQGKQLRREQYVDGRKIIHKKSTFANQTVASERVFHDQKLTAQGTDNWWAAKPATFARDGEEIQHGPVAQWYPNRQPKMTGRYINGQRDGLFTWWHETHNKKAEGKFSKGQRVGLWRYWHESGMKRSEGEFRDDQPFGQWRSWNTDGRVIEEKTFPEESEPAEKAPEAEAEAASSVMDRVERDDTSTESDILETADFKIDLGPGLEKPAESVSDEDPFNENQDKPGLEGIEGEPVTPVDENGNPDPGSLFGG